MVRLPRCFVYHSCAAAVLLAIAGIAPSSVGQEASGDDSTIVYPAEYFAEYAPITAQDMLDRIPGQGQASGSPGGGRGGPPGGGNPSSGGRGLGAGGGNELLVNGKRTAGKSNQTSDLLRRISASQVREIQIIRGTSGDLDVRGSSQVVNIVLFEELPTNTIAYQASLDHYKDNALKPGGRLSLSGQNGPITYQLSGSAEYRYNPAVTKEKSILGNLAPNDLVREERTSDFYRREISANLAYELNDRSSVRVNALYGKNDNPTDVMRYTTDLTTTPNGFTIESEERPNNEDNWEIGGDYELDFANGSRFKILAIANESDSLSKRVRYLWQDDFSQQKNLFLSTDAVTQERIVRSSFTFDLFENQSVEFGLERAQTILDSKLSLGLLTSGTPSDSVGGLVPQRVSNANSTVEEIRYEPFLIHNWTINPRMTLESTLLYEVSEITQTGDVHNQRDFDFIKPKLDFRFDVTPTWQLRGTVEKVVDQLSFSDFVASNDEQDNDANTMAGNAQLRQQWSWRYTFNSEYRLPNDVGVLNAEFFYFDQRDVIERMDASPNENTLVSVNGNIGNGWEYGTNLSASMRMAMIGLPNVLFTYTLNLQDSEITDPFLGIKRRFQNYQRGRNTYVFRQDLPEWRMNWGMQIFDRIDNGMSRYDIDDKETYNGDPRVNLFVEYVSNMGITYRFDGGALTDGA
ncbi:MAG: TonB-dependent receptor, partial [Pseudomonadales bacterium]|nr:TonB-dependent receptor [Pseudomonadales bacterium]